MSNTNIKNFKLCPLYKWTGGKRKEIEKFSLYYPDFVKNGAKYTFIEPFFGGGAVYWSLNSDINIINDNDYELINFLNVLKKNHKKIIKMCNDVSSLIKEISDKEKNKEITISEAKIERGKIYYYWRDKDKNNGLEALTDIERAFRFLIVTQLAFNGMRRFNSKGEFNIPYGNYKSFNVDITESHIDLLNKTEINCGDYKNIILKNDKENTFVFIDPPYTRKFKEYSHENNFDYDEQILLFETFKSIKHAKLMIIINKDEFTEKIYSKYIKSEYDVKYSTNIKNRYDNSVKHLLITNY